MTLDIICLDPLRRWLPLLWIDGLHSFGLVPWLGYRSMVENREISPRSVVDAVEYAVYCCLI